MKILNGAYIIICCIGASMVAPIIPSCKVHLSESWYPRKKSKLLRSLRILGENNSRVAVSFEEPVRALLVPHGGLEYAGSVATAAYAALSYEFYKKIIILAPSHHESFEGIGLPHPHYESYKNVLGKLDLDCETLQALSSHKTIFSYKDHAHEYEHAVLMQLPYIQTYCGKNCVLIPLLIGSLSESMLQAAAHILKGYIDETTLVIVSSDLIHYGLNFGFVPCDHSALSAAYLSELDHHLLETIIEQSVSKYMMFMEQTGAFVCGDYAMRLFLSLLEMDAFGKVGGAVVAYDQSTSYTTAKHHSIGYGSCIFYEADFITNKEE